MSIVALEVAAFLFMGAGGVFGIVAVNVVGSWHDRRGRARVMAGWESRRLGR